MYYHIYDVFIRAVCMHVFMYVCIMFPFFLARFSIQRQESVTGTKVGIDLQELQDKVDKSLKEVRFIYFRTRKYKYRRGHN